MTMTEWQTEKVLSQETTNIRLADFCEKENLLLLNDQMIYLPFIVKGKIQKPPRLTKKRVQNVFSDLDRNRGVSQAEAHYAHIDGAQVIREPVIDRHQMIPTGEYIYTVMPEFHPHEVIENDFAKLRETLYNMPVSKVLDLTSEILHVLTNEENFVDQVRQSTLHTAELPDFWHNAGFSAFSYLLDRKMLAQMIREDLTAWGLSGEKLLDGWQKLDQAQISPAPIHILMDLLFPENESTWRNRQVEIRAMPTRQLHITAGNSPQIPLLSLIRALITKSAAVVKLPIGATAPGALIALTAALSCPEHPLTQNLSVVYWPGGNEQMEAPLFYPDAFDRIVVWGSPDAVGSVKSRAAFTKVLTFNPRYAVSLIGKQAFESEKTLREIAIRGVTDSLVANQKACIASQIHYVEGRDDQVQRYADELRKILATVDASVPNYLKPSVKGQVKRLQRGALLQGHWQTNSFNGSFSSGVVVMKDEFNVAHHPMCRLIVVRPVQSLGQVTAYMHPGVSTVSIYPTSVRLQLRDDLAARGVSNIVDLGQSGTGFAGQSHDGMMVLTELVDWKNG